MSIPARAARATTAVAVLAAVVLGFAAAPSVAARVAPACVPSTLNGSAALAGGAVTVSPAPDTRDASYLTQVSFLGVPAADIADVAVVGSRSGAHSGRLAAYSQGDGMSFLPSKPFAQGELVTVHAALREGAGSTPFAWRFTVAGLDAASHSLETPPGPPPPASSREFQRFVSRPDLKPPAVKVTTSSGSQAPGDVFLAPYAGPGQYGPMILDGAGKLVWFKVVPAGARAADLRAQEYGGRPVLTWWQDPLVAAGRRDAGVVIADSSYKDIAIVRAGNGYQPDLHAFEITPQGTALFTVYDAVRCNLSTYGGPADGAVADTLVQEIDLKTGLVRFEWHSLDHVALADSYMPVRHGGTPTSPWDYFHINAISQQGGDLLVDARNTWAAYDVDHRSGQIAWRLGGKHSSFAMAPGASPAWQHDVRELPDGTISFFDNGGTPKVHAQSRAIVLRLDSHNMTATLVSSFVHSTPLLAPSQGDFQPLAGGDWLVGWGQAPYFSELAPGGQILFDAHLPAAYQSYTVFKFPWSGDPAQPPQVAVRSRPHGAVVYASWNGATAVAQWRVLAGASQRALAPLAVARRSGFETAIAIPTAPRYLAVQALGAQGQALGASATIRF
ncbi:MAG TPA: arylsulfotransferase family protein [Solirubrobacteraceae bacterium]|nr:arylsulfotransferase family protein [Solirubrobacteraceae bacterium]